MSRPCRHITKIRKLSHFTTHLRPCHPLSQPSFFHPGDFHNAGLLPSPYMYSAHSSFISFQIWSPRDSMVSLSCHSRRTSEISVDSSCRLIISPRGSIQLPRPPHFPSASLTSKPPDQTQRSLTSAREQQPDHLQGLSSSSTLIVFAVSFQPSRCVSSRVSVKSLSNL